MDSNIQNGVSDVREGTEAEYTSYCQCLFESDAVQPGSTVENLSIKPITVNNS